MSCFIIRRSAEVEEGAVENCWKCEYQCVAIGNYKVCIIWKRKGKSCFLQFAKTSVFCVSPHLQLPPGFFGLTWSPPITLQRMNVEAVGYEHFYVQSCQFLAIQVGLNSRSKTFCPRSAWADCGWGIRGLLYPWCDHKENSTEMFQGMPVNNVYTYLSFPAPVWHLQLRCEAIQV